MNITIADNSLNATSNASQFWDGRAATLEDPAQGKGAVMELGTH